MKKIVAFYSAGAMNQQIMEIDVDTMESKEHNIPLTQLVDFVVSLQPDCVDLIGSPSFFQKYKDEIEKQAQTKYSKKIEVNLKTRR